MNDLVSQIFRKAIGVMFGYIVEDAKYEFQKKAYEFSEEEFDEN